MPSVLSTFEPKGKGIVMSADGDVEVQGVQFQTEGLGRYQFIVVKTVDDGELFFMKRRMFQDLWEYNLPKSVMKAIDRLALEQADPTSSPIEWWDLYEEFHHEVEIATLRQLVPC